MQMIMAGALFLAAFLAAGQVADSPYGRVTGRVIEQGSNNPIANARVNMFSMARPPANVFQTFEATTDADGKFVLENVPPGEYRLQASKAGYAMQMLDTRPPIVDVSAGQTSRSISLPLVRGGAIAGRVVNAAGEPEAEVQVAALGRIPNAPPTAPLIMSGRPAQTNDLGEYRIYGLPPGEYYVQVNPRPEMGLFNVASQRPTVSVPTYYPGTRTTDVAQKVVVAAGETVRDVDVQVIASPAYQVSGIVVDESGAPVPGAAVSMMPDRSPSSRAPIVFGPPSTALAAPDGTFTLTNLSSGTYRLSAALPVRGGPFAGGGVGAVSFSSSAAFGGAGPGGATTWTLNAPNGISISSDSEAVTVGDANVEGLKLVVRR